MQSPGWAPSPSAAAALSPAPGPSVAPLAVGPPSPHGQLEQVVVVGVGFGGKVPGAAGVAAVGAQLADIGRAAQPPGQPVVRQAHGFSRGGVLGFVVGEPAQFACSDRGDRHHADALRPFGGTAELVDEFGRRGTGASIVPQQRISDDFTGVVKAHHAVLLSADRNGRYVVESACVVDGGLQGSPPQLRVHLSAVGMRRARRAHDLTGGRIAHQDLARLRGRVDARNKSHACEATPVPSDEFSSAAMSLHLCENL